MLNPLHSANARHSQHAVFPNDTITAPVTHVAMSFMRPNVFNVAVGSHDWPAMWQTVQETRAQFREGVKVLIAIGGWGDTEGFSIGARTADSRKRWAANVAAMVSDTGADGAFRPSERGPLVEIDSEADFVA